MAGVVGSRWARKVFCLVFIWGVVMLAVMHLSNHYQLSIQPNPAHRSGGGANSRLLLNKIVLPLEATISTTRAVDMGLEPFVDKSPSLSEAKIIEKVQQRLPSLPIAYWNKYKNKNMFYKNESCAKYPSIFELEFNNIYWQTLHTSNGTFHFYGAYYDIRKLSKIGPAVRILGMINRIEPTVKTYCQFWFENHKEPVFVKTMEYKYIWYKKWGNYKQGIFQPYLIACQIPQPYHKLVPSSVSVVEKVCDIASNNLRIIYNKPEKKKGFAVCVKGLDFLYDDLSVRLIEWIELLGILGAEKVFFYELQVHPNISKVLRHYNDIGKVEVVPLTLPGGQPNIPGFQHLYLTKKVNHKRQNELIPYNDCLYKNLYTYEYIALLDIDEVIMPVKEMSWRALMDKALPKALALKNETRASYNVRNVYFLDDLLHDHGWFKDIPRYMHMLQHVYRSKNFTKPNQYVKCFHNPERALTLHNHFPLACLSSGCTSYAIEVEDAQLQHYRADCVRTLKKTCDEFRHNSVIDTTIWKFKDTLIARVTETLRTLGYFGVSGGIT
uniref:Glycosyltransferase family 92 protein n=1 Tax=Cuerna arida TaxID=1464854 RepID=A0A1B6FCX5_9HEMI